MSRRLYTVQPPISMRGDLMLHSDFYVPNSSAGMKVAAWLEDSSLEQREELFKTAVEEDTQDLAAAFNAMCNPGDTVKVEVTPYVEMEEDDDYGQGTFDEPDEDESDET